MYAEGCFCFAEAKECIALDHTVNQVSNVECKNRVLFFIQRQCILSFMRNFCASHFRLFWWLKVFFGACLLQRTYTQKSHITAINFVQFHAPFSTKWLVYCIRSSVTGNQSKTEIRNMILTDHM